MRQSGKCNIITWVMLIMVGAAGGTAMAEEAVLAALSPGSFKSLLDTSRGNADVVLLDIRTPKEYVSGHIEGAALIDYYAPDFVDRLKALDPQKTYLIYCRSGNRTGRSLAIFQKLGFVHVYHLETGLIGWVKANYPLVPPSSS